MTRNRRSAWRNRLAVVATVFAALAALSTTKAEAVVPSVSVFNVHMAEGNVGQKLMPFSIKLSIPSPAPQWVKVQTVSSGGQPGRARQGLPSHRPVDLSIPAERDQQGLLHDHPGRHRRRVRRDDSVKVIGHSAGINVADGEGVGSITDDDAAPVVTVNDVSKNEGTGAITPFTFSAKLSAASEKPIKVGAVGQSGTAHVPEDLTAGPVTLSFAPGADRAHLHGARERRRQPRAQRDLHGQAQQPDQRRHRRRHRPGHRGQRRLPGCQPAAPAPTEPAAPTAAAAAAESRSANAGVEAEVTDSAPLRRRASRPSGRTPWPRPGRPARRWTGASPDC